jgi:hypothetical protein
LSSLALTLSTTSRYRPAILLALVILINKDGACADSLV